MSLPAPTRELVLELLAERYLKYASGLIGYYDFLLPVLHEPLLAEEEKRQIISNPSSIMMISGKISSTIRIGDVEVTFEEPILIVAENSRRLAEVARSSSVPLVPLNTRRPAAVSGATVFKAVTALVKGFRPRKVVIPVMFSKNMDGLAALLAICRLLEIELVMPAPVVIQGEIVDDERLPIGVQRILLRYSVGRMRVPFGRFSAAVRRLVEDRGLEEKLRVYFGVSTDELAYWEPWWRYMDSFSEPSEEIMRELVAAAVPSPLLRKLAARIASCRDISGIMAELIVYRAPEETLRRVAEIISRHCNVPLDAVLSSIPS